MGGWVGRTVLVDPADRAAAVARVVEGAAFVGLGFHVAHAAGGFLLFLLFVFMGVGRRGGRGCWGCCRCGRRRSGRHFWVGGPGPSGGMMGKWLGFALAPSLVPNVLALFSSLRV